MTTEQLIAELWDDPTCDAYVGTVMRKCPQCGSSEEIPIPVVERALAQGMPDVWLCLPCAFERERTMFPEASHRGRAAARRE